MYSHRSVTMKRLQGESSSWNIERNKQSRVCLIKISEFFSHATHKKDEEVIQLLMTKNILTEVSFLFLNSRQASMIYKDKTVAQFFEFKMWFSASSKDDDIIKTGELSMFLKKTLDGKRFLLVMRDVWKHEKSGSRDKFFDTFLLTMRSKQYGSKIVLITGETEISNLPDFILQNIFCKLPMRSVLNCKSVCKDWYTIIKDPVFPKLHLEQANVYPILRTLEPRFLPSELHLLEVNNTDDLTLINANSSPLVKVHSKILPPQAPLLRIPIEEDLGVPRFGIVNSCNGLLCVCTAPFNNPIYVCNPITGEYIMLPEPELEDPDTNQDYYIMDEEEEGDMYKVDFVVSGFGFSPNTNKYKVMRVMNLCSYQGRFITVQVLTLGSDPYWRTVGYLDNWTEIGVNVLRRQTLTHCEAPYRHSFCVYLNGNVHWIAERTRTLAYIIYFNFNEEIFDEIDPPQEYMEGEKVGAKNMRLGVLRDCLCLSDIASYEQFSLWVLKDYSDPMSWSKEVVIDNFALNIWPRGLYRPIKYLDNGDLLMFHPSNALVCYNPKEESFRYFKIKGIESSFEVVPHAPSLVSLRDVINMEVPEVEILNVR